MARPLRIEYPGAIYHVTARGNERRAIFRSATDRGRFLEKLRDLCEVHRIEVHAYALMTNHYHLVLCTPRGNLVPFMQQFQTSYTMYFNRRHRRTGHLFAGRYKAKLIEGGHYLFLLTRYVHLNPVKTKDVGRIGLGDRLKYLREYRWSSLPGYSGLRAAEDWVSYKALEGFRDYSSDSETRRAYLRFVEEGLEEDDDIFLEELRASSRAYGSEAFRRAVEDHFRNRTAGLDRYVDVSRRRTEAPVPAEEVTAAVLWAYGLTEAALLKRGNREAKYVWIGLLHKESGLTQREIGQLLGHTDGSTVSRHLAHLRSDLTEDAEV
ncbi:MAG: hypothetical protein HON70_38640, partial [Lentisphaerae bacterium]|nr:hypothetical protein [Lentisphaerota bacterium]